MRHYGEIATGGWKGLEVVKFRLLNEYGADALFTPLSYSISRWFCSQEIKAMEDFLSYYHTHIVYDVHGYPMMLFKNDWEREYIEEKNPGIRFYTSLINYERELGS